MTRLEATWHHADAEDYQRPGGPWDTPSLDAVITEATAAAPPGGALLVDGTTRLDGPDLLRLTAALAGALRARGVRRGDAVAWQFPNWHEAVLLYRACWRLGAVAAPLHHLAGETEVAALLARVEPAVVLAGAEVPAASQHGAVIVRGREDRFTALLEEGEAVTAAAARPDDLAVVLFTSGSTGEPKGALHTHRGLAYKARLMAETHRLEPTDSTLMPAPLAHVSGLLNAVLIPGVIPIKAVLMDRWDPERGLSLIGSEDVTFMIGPPTFFVSMQRCPAFRTEAAASLRLISSGGAGVTPSFVERAGDAFGCTVKRTYGSTEAPTVTTSHAGDPPERAASTDGRATGAVRIRITDVATGRSAAPGASGEVWLRGPELFVGYSDPARTAETVTNGWFRTGDLGVMDAAGWLTIVGRMKDVIIRGGENIAAAEVEAVLEAHPAVRQAVAVGRPDDRLGERLVAFVVTAAPFDLGACRAWFSEQGIARYKTPEQVVVLDDLPLLGAGKTDRAALRRRAAAMAPADRA